MNKLDEQELEEINGGGIGIGTLFGIGAAITFIAGIISGYVNPVKCNN